MSHAPWSRVEQPARLITPTTHQSAMAGSTTQVSTQSGDADTNQRLASELAYVTHFATALGSLLGMNALRFGVVDDRESQTAFIQSNGLWIGRISATHQTIKNAQNALTRP